MTCFQVQTGADRQITGESKIVSNCLRIDQSLIFAGERNLRPSWSDRLQFGNYHNLTSPGAKLVPVLLEFPRRSNLATSRVPFSYPSLWHRIHSNTLNTAESTLYIINSEIRFQCKSLQCTLKIPIHLYVNLVEQRHRFVQTGNTSGFFSQFFMKRQSLLKYNLLANRNVTGLSRCKFLL